MDTGTNGIPPLQIQTAATHDIDVLDGVITASWMADGTDLAGTTFTLTAQGAVPPVEWVTGGRWVLLKNKMLLNSSATTAQATLSDLYSQAITAGPLAP